jgi:hypothetical protein
MHAESQNININDSRSCMLLTVIFKITELLTGKKTFMCHCQHLSVNHNDHNAIHNGHNEKFLSVHSANFVFLVVKRM